MVGMIHLARQHLKTMCLYHLVLKDIGLEFHGKNGTPEVCHAACHPEADRGGVPGPDRQER